jgi:hypothetical protein
LERSSDIDKLANDLERLGKDSKKTFFKKGLSQKEYESRILELKNQAILLAFHLKRLAEDNAKNREALEKFLGEAKSLAASNEKILNRVRELESARIISDQNSAQIEMQNAIVLGTLQTILESVNALNGGLS